MATDQNRARRVRDELAGLLGSPSLPGLPGLPGLQEKKMFGGVGFLILGNMACGVNGEDLIVRVGADGYEDALGQPHTRPFDMTGRPMSGWVMVSAEGCEKDAVMQLLAYSNWVRRGVEFARSLPAK